MLEQPTVTELFLVAGRKFDVKSQKENAVFLFSFGGHSLTHNLVRFFIFFTDQPQHRRQYDQ